MGSISIDVEGHIAIVTLDRVPINSLVKATYFEIQKAFNKLGEMEDVRVAVLKAYRLFFNFCLVILAK